MPQLVPFFFINRSVFKSKYSRLFNNLLDLINIEIALRYPRIYDLVRLYNKYYPWIQIFITIFSIIYLTIINEVILNDGFLCMDNDPPLSGSPNPSSPGLPNNPNPSSNNPNPSPNNDWAESYKIFRGQQDEQESDWDRIFRSQQDEQEQENARCESMRLRLQRYFDRSTDLNPSQAVLLRNNRRFTNQDNDYISQKIWEYKARYPNNGASWGHFTSKTTGNFPNRTFNGNITQTFIDKIFGPNNR